MAQAMKHWLSSRGMVWQFALVSGVVMALIGVGLAWLLGRAIEFYFIEALMGEARDTVSSRIIRYLSPQDLERPMTSERYEHFDRWIEESIVSDRTARIKIWNQEGMVVYSNDPEQVGKIYPNKEELEKALAGQIAGELSDLKDQENELEREFGRLFEVYIPIVFPGSDEVMGAFEIYQYYDPAARFIDRTQRYIYLGLTGGLALLYLGLFTIVKRGADTVARQQGELHLRAEDLQEAYQATLEALSGALDLRDHETEGHGRRVTRLAVALAQELGYPEKELDSLVYGAMLHDVGKIGIPDDVLLKPGPLTPEQWEIIRKHPSLGYRVLSKIKFLNGAAEIVRAHHERYDGKGYPRGLAGEKIPLGARIFAVVDAYDAMTCDRPYRKALPHEEAIAELKRNAGTQFDPRVVKTFLRLVESGILSEPEPAWTEIKAPLPMRAWPV